MSEEESKPSNIPNDQGTRQLHLEDLVSRLDQSIPSHQALATAFTYIYANVVEKDRQLSDKLGNSIRPDFHPKAGVERGGYPELDVLSAIPLVEDPYDIFQTIETTEFPPDLKPEEYPEFVAEIISQTTGIPVVWGTPGTFYDPDNPDEIEANMVPIGGDRYVYDWANEPDFDNRGNLGGVEIKTIGENGKTVFTPTDKPAIILNKLYISDPALIQTPGHEVGHIVEKKIGLHKSEVLSALYGIRTAMALAKHNPDLAAKAMIHPLELYNWIIFGTTAP